MFFFFLFFNSTLLVIYTMDNSASSGTQSLERISTAESTPSVKGKIDPVWKHTSQSSGINGRMVLTCLYYAKVFNGG